MPTEIARPISKNRQIVNNTLVESKDRIFHFLLRQTRNQEDAQDILARADDLQDCEKIRGWLSSILRSVLSDHFRKRTQESKKLSEYASFLALLERVEEEPETDFPCVQQNLPKLNPNDRKLIERTDLRAEDRTKISNDLGLSPNTLRVKLHRSRQALGRKIKHANTDCGSECALQAICR